MSNPESCYLTQVSSAFLERFFLEVKSHLYPDPQPERFYQLIKSLKAEIRRFLSITSLLFYYFNKKYACVFFRKKGSIILKKINRILILVTFLGAKPLYERVCPSVIYSTFFGFVPCLFVFNCLIYILIV